MSNQTANAQRTSFKRYRPTNSTATSHATISMITARSALTIFPMSKSLVASILFFGEGADNSTMSFRVYGTVGLCSHTGDGDVNVYAEFLCSGIAQLGAFSVPSTVTAIPYVSSTTTRMADGLFTSAALSTDGVVPSTTSTTPKGNLNTATAGTNGVQSWQTGFGEGTFSVYTPKDDTMARLILPAMARFSGLVIDFDISDGTNTACTSANALIMVDEF